MVETRRRKRKYTEGEPTSEQIASNRKHFNLDNNFKDTMREKKGLKRPVGRPKREVSFEVVQYYARMYHVSEDYARRALGYTKSKYYADKAKKKRGSA